MFLANRVIRPPAEVLSTESSLKDDKPILLLWKSHSERSNDVGLIPPFWGQCLSSEGHASSLELLHFLLADEDQCTARVVLNQDFGCVSRRATSSRTGCRDQLQRKKAILPAGNCPCEARSSGTARRSGADPAGPSVCVLGYDRKKDGDVIWFSPCNRRKIKLFRQNAAGHLIICDTAWWRALCKISLNVHRLVCADMGTLLSPPPSQHATEGGNDITTAKQRSPFRYSEIANY